MKRKKLTNREFDELARKLFDSARADEKEIEAIASKPWLFEGVMAKIAAESQPVKSNFSWKPVFAASFAVVIVAVSLLAYFREGDVPETAVNVSTPQSGPADSVFTPPPFRPSVPVSESRDPADDLPRAEFAATAKTPVVSQEPRKHRAARVRPMKALEPSFYPIGLREKAEDAAIDGRVVRVEMPRSALFALGLDLPLENGTRAIKADLLLGADGSTRAIRLVE